MTDDIEKALPWASFDHEGVDLRADLRRNLHPDDWQNPIVTGRYDLAVIGGGPAGLTAARMAAVYGARVALIETNLLGGDCTNIGCVPTKSLIRSGRLAADIRLAQHFGISAPPILPNADLALARVRKMQDRISRGDAAARLKADGIDLYFGTAAFTGRSMLSVDGQTLHFAKALIATGGQSRPPDIPGLEETGYVTVDSLFDAVTLPKRMMVIGGGPLGTEMAQALCRLGVNVILVHSDPKFLPREERDAAQLLSEALARDGVEIHLNTTAIAARTTPLGKEISLETGGNAFAITVDEVLTGLGRMPRIAGLALDCAGVTADPQTGITVDDFMRTTNRLIYAAGDVCGTYMFAHVADAAARLAVGNALFRQRKRFSKLIIPWCTYTDPEIAHVGLYVSEAVDMGIPTKTYTVLMHEVDRAIVDGEETGFVKIHVRRNTDEILGATIVARHAGEMLNEITLAIQQRIGLRTLSKVMHAYPTQSAAIKAVADACMADDARSRVGSWARFSRRTT